MELVNILIAVFIFCILTISLFLYIKRENNTKLSRMLPSPAPAQLIMSNSWASVENFMNQEKNNVNNSVQSAQEGVEFSTVDADKSKVHKTQILVDSFMQYDKAFDNYILKDPSKLDIPLDKSSDSLIVQTSEVIETPSKSTAELVELRDNNLDRDIVASKIQEIVKDSVLNSITKLKIKESDSIVEDFKDGDENFSIEIITKSLNNLTDKVSNLAETFLGKITSSLTEQFNEEALDNFAKKIGDISDKVVNESNIPKLKDFKAILELLKKEL